MKQNADFRCTCLMFFDAWLTVAIKCTTQNYIWDHDEPHMFEVYIYVVKSTFRVNSKGCWNVGFSRQTSHFSLTSIYTEGVIMLIEFINPNTTDTTIIHTHTHTFSQARTIYNVFIIVAAFNAATEPTNIKMKMCTNCWAVVQVIKRLLCLRHGFNNNCEWGRLLLVRVKGILLWSKCSHGCGLGRRFNLVTELPSLIYIRTQHMYT